MITVEYNDMFYKCDNCENEGIVNFIGSDNSAIVLCDDCLQELNRKIVDHLAEKNL